MGKERRQVGVGDWEIEQALQKRPSFLAEVERLADWSAFERRLEPLKKNTDIGRPQIPPLVLFKVLLLEQWYGSSSGMD